MLAAVVYAWPVHARAASSYTFDGGTGKQTLGDFSSRDCGFGFEIGYKAVPQVSGLDPNADGLQAFNDENCVIVQNNRARQSLWLTVIGSALTIWALNRRFRRERQREMAVLLAAA